MGTAITVDAKGKFIVPDDPIIPCIAGDGIGPDIWNAGKPVLDCAVAKAYGGRRRIEWLPVRAGEDCWKETGEFVPEATKEAITKYRVAIKGPLSTPVGKGFRSVNVMLRQMYDLYAGVEWDHDTPEAERVIALIKELGKNVRPHSAIGIKPISEFGSKRLVRMAIQYAIDHKLPNVTLVHKGNIMKFTEGGFRRWGYEVAAEEFGDVTITEEEVTKNFGGKAPEGKIVIKDRITDAMFQQILLRPAEYSVLALPNLNGDYMSDALAAEVGGLGMAPGSNIGEGYAIFEATHGTAPKYAGQDKTNPGSIILSGALMLEYIGWKEAAELIRKAVEKTVAAKTVTYDLARQMPGATKISCSAFGKAICEHM